MKIKTIMVAPWPTSVLGLLVQQGMCPAYMLPLTFPPEPYTVREARIHVRHVRDLLKSLDPSDAFNGVDCNSLSFLSVFTDGDLGGAGGIGAGGWAEGPGANWPGVSEGVGGQALPPEGGRAGGIHAVASLPLGGPVLTVSLGSLRQREAEEGLGDGPH